MLEYQKSEIERKVTNKTSFQSYFGNDIVVLVYKTVKFITEWTQIFFQKKIIRFQTFVKSTYFKMLNRKFKTISMSVWIFTKRAGSRQTRTIRTI